MIFFLKAKINHMLFRWVNYESLLAACLVGKLVETTTTSKASQPPSSKNLLPPPTNTLLPPLTSSSKPTVKGKLSFFIVLWNDNWDKFYDGNGLAQNKLIVVSRIYPPSRRSSNRQNISFIYKKICSISIYKVKLTIYYLN